MGGGGRENAKIKSHSTKQQGRSAVRRGTNKNITILRSSARKRIYYLVVPGWRCYDGRTTTPRTTTDEEDNGNGQLTVARQNVVWRFSVTVKIRDYV